MLQPINVALWLDSIYANLCAKSLELLRKGQRIAMDSWHKDPVGIGLGQGTYGLSHPKARRTWGRERSEMQSQKPLQTKTTRTTRTTQNSTGQFVNGSSASYHSLVALSICQHFFNTSTHTHIPHIFTSCTCHSHVIHVSFQHEAVAKPHHNQPILHCAGGANGLFHICTEEIRLSTSVTKCNESMIFYQGN